MRLYFTLALAGLAAAGCLTAVMLFAPPPADAGTVSLIDLPGLGYSLGVRVDASATPACQTYWVLSGNGAPETLIGDFNDTNHPACNTDPAVLQSRIDQLVANYPPRPTPPTTVTVTQPAETVTTTLPAVTVTAPAVTVTGPTVTAPAVTIAAPSVVVTVPGAGPPAQVVTQTVTQTVTTTQKVRDPGLAATIKRLRAQLAKAKARRR